LVTFGAANFIVFLRSYVTASKSQGADRRERAAPILLIALAVCSILIMLGMGWVRETARASNGYLIYGKMRLSDERSTYEAPR